MKLMRDIKEGAAFLKRLSIKPAYFAIPAVFALGASLLEGLSVGLLLPLVNAILYLDIGLLRNAPVVGTVVKQLPASMFGHHFLFAAMLLLIFGIVLLKQAMQYGSTTFSALLIRRFANRLRCYLFARYLDFGKLFFDRHNSGELQETLLGLTQYIAVRLHDAEGILMNFFLLVVYIAVLFFISWKLTLLTLLIFPVLHYALNWIIAKIKRTSEDYAVSQNALGKKMFNVLSCIPLVKAYNREEEEKKRFGHISSQVEMFEFSIDKKMGFISPFQESIMMVAILVMIATMAFMTIRGGGRDMLAGFLVYFYVLRRAAMSFGILNQAKGCLAAIEGLVERIRSMIASGADCRIVDGAVEFQGLKSGIEFKNLNFQYTADQPVLQNISFKIERGKMTALVGPTGSGKTTLIHLLMRYYDCPAGTILMDGADIRSFTLNSLHLRTAIVSQETQLFHESLHYNLTYGLNRAVSDEELISVVQKARLEDYVKSLVRGLETPVGDRGVQLSGGEKQRVSIARAMLKRAEILILDEATSSLDSHTEQLIGEALEELTKGHTVLVIAHRLSTIRKADQIIYLENGRLVEHGPPEELLARRGHFFAAWERQSL